MPGDANVNPHQLAERLVLTADLEFIRTTRAEAELLDWEAASNVEDIDDSTSSVTLQFGISAPGELAYRMTHELVLKGHDGTDAARVLVELLAGFRYSTDQTEPSREEIEAFADTTAVRVMYPFFREAAMSLLSRVGIDGPLIGLIKFKPGNRDGTQG